MPGSLSYLGHIMFLQIEVEASGRSHQMSTYNLQESVHIDRAHGPVAACSLCRVPLNCNYSALINFDPTRVIFWPEGGQYIEAACLNGFMCSQSRIRHKSRTQAVSRINLDSAKTKCSSTSKWVNVKPHRGRAMGAETVLGLQVHISLQSNHMSANLVYRRP